VDAAFFITSLMPVMVKPWWRLFKTSLGAKHAVQHG
jgi:hypothetical protein